MFLFKDKIYKAENGKYYTGEYLEHNGGTALGIKEDDEIRGEYETGTIINCNYSQIFDGDCILCNNIMEHNWETMELYSPGTEEEPEIFQYYIISNWVADMLMKHTNEVIYYDHKLDIYVLGITHYGTSWDYVGAEWKM